LKSSWPGLVPAIDVLPVVIGQAFDCPAFRGATELTKLLIYRVAKWLKEIARSNRCRPRTRAAAD
jgi:hypothetical protein